jgi:hypothetical protein
MSALSAGRHLPPGHSFLLEAESMSHSAAGRIRSIEKSSDLNENRIRDLPACSVGPPTPSSSSKNAFICISRRLFLCDLVREKLQCM